VIIGGSGSGKSVLLKCISGLHQFDSGEIQLDGEVLSTKVNGKKPHSLKKLGYIFQNAALFDSFTVLENIMFGIKNVLKLSKKDSEDLAFEKLSLVGINRKTGDLYPGDISTGLRKAVALARTLAMGSDIILFDEPTTGLDPIMSKKINDLIIKCIQTESLTAVTITHDMESAKRLGDKIAMLYAGELIWTGKPSEIKNTDNAIVQQFTNGHIDGPISLMDFPISEK
jgi:phospholipid/cholesterol/gamma-HCH transport system ATP-binding protein